MAKKKALPTEIAPVVVLDNPAFLPFREPAKAVVGHEQALSFFRHAHDSNRLAHAYLITGPEHVGKSTVAAWLAAMALGSTGPLTQHPDMLVVTRERDAKTGKLHGEIVLDQVQDACSRLAMTAFFGGWKVCVIDGVHALNRESANALLKTLEEPRPKTLLFLLATSLGAVMPTIRSRCQTVRLGRVPPAVMERALTEAQLGATAAIADAVRLSDGRPGRAISFLRQPEEMAARKTLWNNVVSMCSAGLVERFDAIDRIIPAKTPFQESVEIADDVLAFGAEFVASVLAAQSGIPSAAETDAVRRCGERWERATSARILDEILMTKRCIADNVHPRAALEQLALAFG